jgi:hypothetical protein
MDIIDDEMLDPNPPTPDGPPTGPPGVVGPAPARAEAFPVPSLANIKSMPYFAERWHRLHRDVPLVPLRRVGPRRGRPSSGRAAWAPVEGWSASPHSARELARLLKADPSLRIGVKLGPLGPGGPWLVDILARDAKEAAPALRRMLDRHARDFVGRWHDEEGTHRVFVGDGRLARYGPALVGAYKGNGGDPRYAGLEIRVGGGGPADSLLVLPPPPSGDGKPRRGRGRVDEFPPLPEGAYADLDRHAGPAGDAPDVPRAAPALAATMAIPREDGPRPRPRRARRATALVVATAGLPPGEATLVESRGPGAAGTPTPLELATMSASILEEIRAGDLLMFRGLEHYRRAGEMLERAKDRVGHGGFERFVEDRCGFSTETANAYKRVYLRWAEVEAMRGANPQSAADLTLAAALKGLARPRKNSAIGVGPATPESGGEVAPQCLDRSPVDSDIPIAPGRGDEPAGGDSPGPRPGEARGDGGPVSDGALDGGAGATPTAARGEAAPDGADGAEVRRAGRRARPPARVPIKDEGRRRAGDPGYRRGHCPIRARLKELGNTRHFDAAATLWRLLRPLAAEILARHRPGDPVIGFHAVLIVGLARARPPEQWDLCPSCDGAGRGGPDGEECRTCLGVGYRTEG